MSWDSPTRRMPSPPPARQCKAAKCPHRDQLLRHLLRRVCARSGSAFSIVSRDDIHKSRQAALDDCGKRGKACKIIGRCAPTAQAGRAELGPDAGGVDAACGASRELDPRAAFAGPAMWCLQASPALSQSASAAASASRTNRSPAAARTAADRARHRTAANGSRRAASARRGASVAAEGGGGGGGGGGNFDGMWASASAGRTCSDRTTATVAISGGQMVRMALPAGSAAAARCPVSGPAAACPPRSAGTCRGAAAPARSGGAMAVSVLDAVKQWEDVVALRSEQQRGRPLSALSPWRSCCTPLRRCPQSARSAAASASRTSRFPAAARTAAARARPRTSVNANGPRAASARPIALARPSGGGGGGGGGQLRRPVGGRQRWQAVRLR